VLPDGSSYSLDQYPGANQVGDAGLKDQVDNHYWSTFGAAAAIGLISGLAQAIGTAGNPAQYLIAQRYLESLSAIAVGADKLVFMPYEASGALASLGGIKELFQQK